jgi:hypothetical protein
MTPKDVIKNTIGMCHEILTVYLSDMEDGDLMVRPVPEANHAAWQLGHLISAERQMMSDAGFTMPDLPDGFAESHTPETSKSDDAARFLKKDEYLTLLEQQRDATLVALDATPNADLDKAAPESMREYAPTIGIAFNVVGIHEVMHAAQFVAVRRMLGKPVMI